MAKVRYLAKLEDVQCDLPPQILGAPPVVSTFDPSKTNADIYPQIHLEVPEQNITCLSFIPMYPDHFVAGSRYWTSVESTNPFDLTQPVSSDSGQLTLCRYSDDEDELIVVQSLTIPSGILTLHVSASRIATGTVDGHVRTYDILDTSDTISLALAQDQSFFPGRAITSIQYHPFLLSILTCTLSTGATFIIKLSRSTLSPAQPGTFQILGQYLPNAQRIIWAGVPESHLTHRNERDDHALYYAGNDGALHRVFWRTESFLVKEDGDVDYPEAIRGIHDGKAVTGVENIMVPGRTRSRDALVTVGQDGMARVIDQLAFELKEGSVAKAATLMGGNRGFWDMKMLRMDHIPDENLEDTLEWISFGFEEADQELQSETEAEGTDQTTEAGGLTEIAGMDHSETETREEDGGLANGNRDKENVNVDTEFLVEMSEEKEVPKNQHSDPDEFRLPNYGQSEILRHYRLITGDLELGPTVLEVVFYPGNVNARRREDKFTIMKKAAFDGHGTESAYAFDIHHYEGKIIGASASFGKGVHGEPRAKVCVWEYMESVFKYF